MKAFKTYNLGMIGTNYLIICRAGTLNAIRIGTVSPILYGDMYLTAVSLLFTLITKQYKFNN